MTTTQTTPTQEATMTTPYVVGQAVEINKPDFSTPGFPRRWFPGVVDAVKQEGRLFQITVIAQNTTCAPGVTGYNVELVNRRGQNSNLRPA